MMIWLRRAVERDDCWGAVNLARVYLFDRGTRAEQAEAIALLRHYARSRDVEANEAMLALADAHEEGCGVPRSAEHAAAWRARAARRVEREIARGRILDDA